MSRPSSPRLAITRLSFVLPDGRPLLHDITVGLTDERVGLIGPNGAGKSTLLRLIAGELTASAGTLSVDPSCQYVPQRTADISAQSGGEATRAAIASALHAAPRLLLLDEPSNHLDRAGRRWLAGVVRRWPYALLVATHDRELLGHVDRIIELRDGSARSFGGAWPAFAAWQRAEERRLSQLVASADAELRRTERAARTLHDRKAHADARGRRTRATGSQPPVVLNARRERAQSSGGRLRAVTARLHDEAVAELRDARSALGQRVPLRLQLPAASVPSTATVVAIANGWVDHPNRRVLAGVDLAIRGPERVALTGPNGAGKSTLLRVIAGVHALTAGTLQRAIPLDRVVWLDQGTLALQRAAALVDIVAEQLPQWSPEAAHACLARAGFRGADAYRRAESLSGGEQVRVALASLFATTEPPQVLLLDEPTNHLDQDAVRQLEAAVRDFTGAVILVSHDDAFHRAVGVTRAVDVAAWRVPDGSR